MNFCITYDDKICGVLFVALDLEMYLWRFLKPKMQYMFTVSFALLIILLFPPDRIMQILPMSYTLCYVWFGCLWAEPLKYCLVFHVTDKPHKPWCVFALYIFYNQWVSFAGISRSAVPFYIACHLYPVRYLAWYVLFSFMLFMTSSLFQVSFKLDFIKIRSLVEHEQLMGVYWSDVLFWL